MKYLNNLRVLLTFYLAGCAVSPVYKLTPITTGGEYHNGRLIMSVKDGKAKSVLNFDAQAGGCFSFFIVIENISDSSINIYPEDFYAEIIKNEPAGDSLEPPRLYAFNPETQLETIDKNIAALNSQKNFNDGMNCLFLGAVIATDLAAIGMSKSEEEITVRRDITDALFDKIENDEINFRERKYELEKDINHWQYEVLRINTLLPGEKAGGLFYNPHFTQSKKV